jgi:hypothetical protein
MLHNHGKRNEIPPSIATASTPFLERVEEIGASIGFGIPLIFSVDNSVNARNCVIASETMDPDIISRKTHMRTAMIGAGTMSFGVAHVFSLKWM